MEENNSRKDDLNTTKDDHAVEEVSKQSDDTGISKGEIQFEPTNEHVFSTLVESIQNLTIGIERLVRQVKKNRNIPIINIINVVATVVMAIAVAYSVQITYLMWNTQREDNKAQFQITTSSIRLFQNARDFGGRALFSKDLTVKPFFGTFFEFTNEGQHPADNLSIVVRLFNTDDYSPLGEIYIMDSADKLFKGNKTYIYSHVFSAGENVIPLYLHFRLNYVDSVLNKNINQEFFKEWPGPESVAVGNMTPEEKQILKEKLKLID